MTKKRNFTWMAFDYDFDGEAYIIAKDECPNMEDVPEYICTVDNIHQDCKPDMKVQEGWCAFQVRSDWDNYYGEPAGWYVVEQQKEPPKNSMTGKKKPGWFPVWIVRKEDWY